MEERKGRPLVVSHATIKAQIAAVLGAWGMAPDHVETTSALMADADLRGIDSHGLSMLTLYDEWRTVSLTLAGTKVAVVQETPVSVLVDGGGGLGYVPSMLAVETGIRKARETGICIAAVRNSAHFGAAGYYTRAIAEAGFIGMAATSCPRVQVVPTFGAEPKLSTDPWSFAAPAGHNPPFVLDMATSTTAAGKVRNYANEGKPIPPGWAVDSAGNPVTDAERAFRIGAFLTPLGATREMGSHKGYGLAVMVNILSTCLSGGSLVTSEGHPRRTPGNQELNHYFQIMDPALFRPKDDFTASVDELIDSLRQTRPIDPSAPVLVAGDPEEATKQRRMRDGIEVAPGLFRKIEQVALRSGAPFLLESAIT
jgi:LDH2 family malate/lactate/ureidoglycolate dehydrogenase